MIISSILFYVFAAITVISGLMVISSKNSVHSVLFLILGFFNAAGLFVLLGAEFLAMILVIVYVGAVAVLFLFIVMMLDVNFAALREGFMRYLPLGLLIAAILFIEIMVALNIGISGAHHFNSEPTYITGEAATNAHAIGMILYTDYILLFQLSGLILLVAMIGAIVLTLREREGVKKQNINKQLSRTVRNSVRMAKVKSGKGL